MLGLILAINIRELKNLGALYHAGDFERLRKTCHKSKPTMLYLGASSLKEDLEHLEKNFPQQFELLYPPFLEKIELLEQEIDDFLREMDTD